MPDNGQYCAGKITVNLECGSMASSFSRSCRIAFSSALYLGIMLWRGIMALRDVVLLWRVMLLWNVCVLLVSVGLLRMVNRVRIGLRAVLLLVSVGLFRMVNRVRLRGVLALRDVCMLLVSVGLLRMIIRLRPSWLDLWMIFLLRHVLAALGFIALHILIPCGSPLPFLHACILLPVAPLVHA